MKYKVVITEQANVDLKEIYEYIAFNLQEPGVAINQLERIEKAILSLDENPNRFRIYDKEPWFSRGLRQLPVDNFIVFYIPETEVGIVTVIRVMYGGRDRDEQLNNTDQ